MGRYYGIGSLDNAYVVLQVIHSILTKDKRIYQGTPCLTLNWIWVKLMID